MQGLKNLPEVGPGGQVLEAPTCCQRAPPCVRPPPRPTPDWAFWHLCLCTLHSTRPPGAGPGCKTGPGAGTCASSAHYKSCHSGRGAPDPRGRGLSCGALQRFSTVPLTLRGLCADLVDNSTPRPSFPVAFHPQRADPQAAARLTSSTCIPPPPTNNHSPFKFSLVSPEKPTPRFCPNFPRAERVEECEVHTFASFLARKQDCPFSGGSSPHTPSGKKVRMLAN